MSDRCNSTGTLYKDFVIIFLLFGVLVVIAGVLLILIEGDCELETGQDESSNHLTLLRSFCDKLHHSLNIYKNDVSITGVIHRPELTKRLLDICAENGADLHTNRINCTKWTLSNIVTWLSFASSTVFTIGNGYVVPKTTAGIILVMIYASIAMPIALSMLAIAGKIMIHHVTQLIEWFETRYIGKEKVTYVYVKIMIVLFLFFVLCIVLGSVMTTNTNLDNMTWLIAVFYWFENMTTIGDIPVQGTIYEGWQCVMLVPYALILFFGLFTTAAMLSLSLKMIMKCDCGMLCCCKGRNLETDQSEGENEMASAYDYDSDEFEGSTDIALEKNESQKPLLRN